MTNGQWTMTGLSGRVGLGMLALVLLLAACATPQAAEEADSETEVAPPRATPTRIAGAQIEAANETVTPRATFDASGVTPTRMTATPPATPIPLLGPPIAPDFRLPDLEGEMWELSQFRGRPVMLFFWATW